MDGLMILVAPNGARKTKKDHPDIPLSAAELGAEAKRCADAGAALFHLHVRDAEAGHTLGLTEYRRAIDEIKKQAGDSLIIQATTESCGIYEPHEQMAMARELKPEAISVAIREVIPDISHEGKAGEFFHWAAESGVVPQYILYSPEEVRYFAELAERGVIPAGRKFLLFVLGRKNSPDAAKGWAVPGDLAPFMEAKDKHLAGLDFAWAICAFGGNEQACMMEAVRHGGHARVGFENNTLLADGSQAPDNAALVRQLAAAAGKKLVGAEAARAFLSC